MVVLTVGHSDSQAMVFSAPLRRLGDDASMMLPADLFPNSTPETPRWSQRQCARELDVRVLNNGTCKTTSRPGPVG